MTPELPEALKVLFHVGDVFDELGLSWHLGGSYASSVHGIPRQTQDIDLVLNLDEVTAVELARRLEDAFYLDVDDIQSAVRDKRSVNFIHLDTGIKIDIFICGDHPYDIEEASRVKSEYLLESSKRSIKVKSAEDTILRKLQWYAIGGKTSERQWNDVLGIIKTQGGRLDTGYLKRWAGELQLEEMLNKLLLGSGLES